MAISKSKELTADDVRALLRKACDAAGSQLNWGRQNNFSAPFISDILQGRRDPSESLCAALGIERLTVYRMVR